MPAKVLGDALNQAFGEAHPKRKKPTEMKRSPKPAPMASKCEAGGATFIAVLNSLTVGFDSQLDKSGWETFSPVNSRWVERSPAERSLSGDRRDTGPFISTTTYTLPHAERAAKEVSPESASKAWLSRGAWSNQSALGTRTVVPPELLKSGVLGTKERKVRLSVCYDATHHF